MGKKFNKSQMLQQMLQEVQNTMYLVKEALDNKEYDEADRVVYESMQKLQKVINYIE